VSRTLCPDWRNGQGWAFDVIPPSPPHVGRFARDSAPGGDALSRGLRLGPHTFMGDHFTPQSDTDSPTAADMSVVSYRRIRSLGGERRVWSQIRDNHCKGLTDLCRQVPEGLRGSALGEFVAIDIQTEEAFLAATPGVDYAGNFSESDRTGSFDFKGRVAISGQEPIATPPLDDEYPTRKTPAIRS